MEAEHEDAPAKVNENAHARKRPVPPTTLDDDEGLARAIELSQRKVDDDLDAALARSLHDARREVIAVESASEPDEDLDPDDIMQTARCMAA